ncbi:2-dehydro-3-deoxygalactonokinase [Dyella caseinilytica]|uniref:2-dehydro-3-deoxygalactonokinase n=1 Tax=Dyella caseinilytica TaxID=1849581 RepID=A0ABX7GTY8_9GAMM|nr:2-dehydro-3-deoxygalactonokinase [Dyella caseinilytica]QRN53882.1 2-dehydro-3-deoxygalactonokinase [Dyella caseinilytica]GFZ89835.1 2-dehydro-3-deoxygalactonokinase [Dyella caseinilytica]
MSQHAQLIGLDWGTSSLRAYLYDGDGKVIASRQHAWGIRHLPEGGFPSALRAITSGWPPCTIVAAGMVGSRQGWREVPYLDLPADAAAIAHGMLRVEACTSHALWIAPGLHRKEPADVMRGEETQIVGALTLRPEYQADACFVLPGTHSKWATVNGGRIVAFDTVMTGELYALLMKHSILGAGIDLARERSFCEETFARGVRAVKDSGASGVFGCLFSVRALMLAGQLAADDLPDFVSGLLIGEEFRIASLRQIQAAPLCLIGEPALCQRYIVAAAIFGHAPPTVIDDAAAQGLWRIASAGGLLEHATLHSYAGADT